MLLFSAILVDALSCGLLPSLSLSLSLCPSSSRVYLCLVALLVFPSALICGTVVHQTKFNPRPKSPFDFPSPPPAPSRRHDGAPCVCVPVCPDAFERMQFLFRLPPITIAPRKIKRESVGMEFAPARRNRYREATFFPRTKVNRSRKKHLKRSLRSYHSLHVAISFSLSTMLLARGKFTIKRDTWSPYWRNEFDASTSDEVRINSKLNLLSLWRLKISIL